jgi:hypothetical protein
MSKKYATGAEESPYDVRTFAYVPSGVPVSGGARYTAKDIEDQHRVGICTAISTTQNARKALKKKFSADFQYLMQKKFRDQNWNEGSSLSSALWVAHKIGLLPEEHWTFTTEADRKLSYAKYIKKLQAVPEKEIERLKTIASKYKILAYSKVPVDRDLMAQAINESASGLLTRYALGKEWWTDPVEPLRPPKTVISGHAVTDSNYNGTSFRVANTWGTDWADKGTAYRLQKDYAPTECWLPHYKIVPEVVQKQLDSRTELQGKILNALQEIIRLYQKLK